MTHQSDISDILGKMADAPMGAGGGLKVGAASQAFLRRWYSAGDMRGLSPPRTRSFDTQTLRLPAGPEIPRLCAAPSQAKEGEGSVSGFVANIEARIAIINKMIPSAKTSERRTLQKERSDLEAKLRKVSA